MSSLASSIEFPSTLHVYVKARAVLSRDLNAVALLFNAGGSSEVAPLAWIACALVLGTSRSGHTCVDLNQIGLWAPESNDRELFDWPEQANLWIDALRACPTLVCVPEERDSAPRRPFILSGSRLYSARSFDEELRVAAYLRDAIKSGQVEIITGGPGSGKTYTTAQKIIAYVGSMIGENSLALAAPTGLAAKRMDRALRSAMQELKRKGLLPVGVQEIIEQLPKLTLHKLLKYNPVARAQWRFNKLDTMPYDYVIIDEVSMMPLSMMARVLEAMKKGSRLLLVGDPFQLASVEAGTVLADIVKASEKGNFSVQPQPYNFRFKDGSPVSDISIATKEGNFDEAMAAVKRHQKIPHIDGNFRWVDPVNEQTVLQDIAREVVLHARGLCNLAASAITEEDFGKVLALRDSVQVVCAHRRGNMGVSGWNSAVERQLGTLAEGQWYLGRPVMVTKNDYDTGLSNGDIGVVCQNSTGGRVVVFGDTEGVKVLPVSRLPQVETVHAITIHKSQGSEFEHTIVVLPTGKSRILTRELLYTGITRAKPNLTLIATQDALRAAIETPVQRATGLADLI